MDQEPPVSLSLVLRHRHYAGYVVFLLTVFFLREISDEMASFAVVFRQDIEQEGLNVVVQGLVVEEQFGEEAQVLTVYLVGVSVDLEHGDVAAAVDLRGGRVAPQTLVEMPH